MSMNPGAEQYIQYFVANRAAYLGYLMVMCRDSELAEDLFQELSLIVIKDIEKFDTSRDFNLWVRGICRTLFRKAMERTGRRTRRQISLDPDLMESVLAIYDEKDDQASMQKASMTALLNDCVEKLSPVHREILVSRYEGNRSSVEIGAAFNRSVAAVDTMLSRLRAVLLDCVQRGNEAKA